MTRRPLLAVLALVLVGCADDPLPQAATAPVTPTAKRPTIVLVHGAFGGGWGFHQVGDLLTDDGYRVYRPTLTGQGERAHLASPAVDLDTHVNDIVNLIRFEDLHDVVLVGHSYGGMVVTGVADRLPGRIKRVIYLDAFLPLDGETGSQEAGRLKHRRGPTGPDATGYLPATGPVATRPPPHDVNQPGGTFTEPIRLRRPPNRSGLPTAYVLYVMPGQASDDAKFAFFARRAAGFGWPVSTLTSDHNAQWSHPHELVRRIEMLAGGR